MSTDVGMESKAREAIQLLTELQGIDDELLDIALERGDLPEEVERLEREIAELEAFIAQHKQALEETVQLLASRTEGLADAKIRQGKLQEQLYAVKTTREYDAITTEFNFVKDEIGKCETDIAGAIQRKAELTKQVEERLTVLEKTRGEEKIKGKELREKLSETEHDELQLRHRRENVVVRLPKPLYAHYERIRKAKDGRGVARILDSACGGCFAVIPPQTQVNIRKMTDIVLCETCGRIIVP